MKLVLLLALVFPFSLGGAPLLSSGEPQKEEKRKKKGQEDDFDPHQEEFEKLKAQFDDEKSKEPYERIQTIEKMGEHPAKEAVPFLSGILMGERESAPIVGAAVRALGKIGTRPAVAAILEHGVEPLVGDLNIASLAQALANPLEDEAEELCIKQGLNEVVRRDPEALKIMISALASLRSERKIPLLQKELRKGATPGIRLAILRALRDLRPPEAAGIVHPLLRDPSAEIQVAVLEVLEAVKATAYAREYAALLKSPHWQVRALAVDLISLVSPPEIVRQVVPLLADPDYRVRVGAVQALTARGGDTVIEPLIRALEKNEGRVLDDVADGLARLTGKDFGTNPAQWESWWAANKGRVEIKRKPASEMAKIKDSQPEKLTAISTYFGLRVLSKNVAFIFDCSDSMTEPYEPPGTRKETREKPGETGKTVPRAGGAKAAKPKPAGPEETARKKNLLAKMEVARGELLKIVDHLPSDVRVNIIRFNTLVEAWQTALTPLDPEMKQEAKTFVQTSTPAGLTNVFAAIEEAFKDEKLDTVYLLSDGAPTLGIVETGELLDAVERLNKVRKVKINTIGFHLKPDERRLMEELAEKNYGIFLSR